MLFSLPSEFSTLEVTAFSVIGSIKKDEYERYFPLNSLENTIEPICVPTAKNTGINMQVISIVVFRAFSISFFTAVRLFL